MQSAKTHHNIDIAQVSFYHAMFCKVCLLFQNDDKETEFVTA
jgi:hypothetical protein